MRYLPDNPSVTGFAYFFYGFELIIKPGIRRFVVIPLLINIILFSLLIVTAARYYHLATFWVSHFLPSGLAWLVSILWLLFIAAFMLFFIYAFTFFANIISAPFNAFLAERVETYLAGRRLTQDIPWHKIIHEALRIGKREIQKLLYYLPRAIFLLLCLFIPGVNVVVTVLWFTFNGWMLALQYLDYAFDNHRVSFLEMRVAMQKQRWRCLCFGLVSLFFSMVPVINFLVIPVSVAGATKLWYQHIAPHHLDELT